MNASDSESPTPRSDWQAESARPRRSKAAVYARRILMTLILAATLCAIMVSVFLLFRRSATHFAILRSGGLPALHGPPATVVGPNTAFFQPLEDLLRYHGSDELDELLSSSLEMKQLEDRLRRLSADGGDAFILYVAAQGISFRGKAHLVCDNFDPADPDNGIYPFSELLTQFTAAVPEESTKLLIIDAGQYDYDPQIGLVISEFPRLLQEDVARTNDDRLWVLCSHSTSQKSHLSRALGGSVFGAFVGQGLRGHADGAIDGRKDQRVTVQELERFVGSNVGEWVGRSTNQQASQTPRMLWGGRTDSTAATFLLAVTDPPQTELTSASMIREAERTPQSRASTRQDASRRGFLSRSAPSEDATPASAPTRGEPAAADAQPADSGAPQEAVADAEQPSVDRRLRELFSRAWGIRDQLNDDPSAERAVDETPHLWRELQEELIAYEQELTATDADEQRLRSIAALLETTIPMFSREVENQSVLVRDLLAIGATAPAAAELAATNDVRTLALARLAADQGWFKPRDNVAELASQLDAMLQLPVAEFAALLAAKTGWEEHYDRYYELRLLKELAARKLDPELIQLAVRTRRDGELAATTELGSSSWLMEDVLDGDRFRLAGERQLVDQIGSQWRQRARDNLVRAQDQYRAAREEAREIQHVIRLRNDLLFEAPYYVQWYRASHATWTKDSLQQYHAINRFLEQLKRLSDLIDVPTPDGSVTIKRLGQDLARLRDQRIRVRDGQQSLQNPSDGDAWRIDRMLETPLPASGVRQQLLNEARDIDADIVRQFELNRPTNAPTDSWDQRLRLCALEVNFARLTAWPLDGDAGFDELQQASADLAQAISANETEDILWKTYHKFSQQLRAFHARQRELLRRIQRGEIPGPTRDEAHAKVVRAERVLRLLDARDARQFRDMRVSSVARRLRAHDALKWQQRRFAVARADASQTEAEFLDQVVGSYQLQALKLLRPSAADSLAGLQVLVDVPEKLSLLQSSKRELPISFTYLGSGQADTWFVLQYNPNLIEVSAPDDVYHEHQLRDRMRTVFASDASGAEIGPSKTRRAFQYPYRPDLVQLKPTFAGVNNGATRSMRLTVSAKSADVDLAQLVVKAIVPSPGDAATEDPQTYLRRPVELAFRTFDLVVDGPPSSWSQLGERITIYPYPNRLTDFRFGVNNYGPRERNVTLKFYVPSQAVDLTGLTPEVILRQVEGLVPADTITLENVATGMRFATAAGNGEDSAAAAPAVGEASDASAAAPAAEPPAGPALQHGLLIELADPNDARFRFVRHIDVVTQRPRRYVRPRVRYNATQERIDVTVTPRDKSLVPSGPIPVECEVVEISASRTEGKLRDTITAAKPVARLFVNIPAIPAQQVTLRLHVDGYPRAFVYRVPCGAETADIGELTDLVAARMVKPNAIEGFQAPAPTTPIELQIDAPVGSFEKPGDLAMLALDEDFNDQLNSESALRFTSDRQVNSYVQSLAEGTLSLDTRVSDYNVPLSTNKLSNVAIKVLGQLSAGESDEDADPLVLRIDGDGPRIHRVSLNPPSGYIVTGEELEINVWARDQMSRIRKIEAAFDVDGTGEFPNAAQAIEAAYDPFVQRWTARLSTEKLRGAQTLLVRAIDIVENKSATFSVPVRVLTPEQVEIVNVMQPKVVRGIVTFDKQRIENVDVTLVAPDGRALTPVRTDAQGRFRFARVPPGEYVLAARGAFHNVARRANRPIVIDSDAGRVVHADLELQ